MLERDHVELLGRLAVHAVVLDPAGPEGSRPCNGKQNFPCLLTSKQMRRVPSDYGGKTQEAASKAAQGHESAKTAHWNTREHLGGLRLGEHV